MGTGTMSGSLLGIAQRRFLRQISAFEKRSQPSSLQNAVQDHVNDKETYSANEMYPA